MKSMSSADDNQPFAAVSRLLRGAAALVALVPGVAMVAKIVAIPPTLQNTIVALSLAIGVTVVIVILLLSRQICKLSTLWAVAGVLGLVFFGALLVLQYLHFAAEHLVTIEASGEPTEIWLLPLHPPKALTDSINDFNGHWGDAITSPIVGAKVRQLIENNNTSSGVVLMLYVLSAQTFLLTAIVGGAWRGACVLGKASGPRNG
jgi:hypothetical protein